MKYVALLRGINVGGHHKVPMAELRKTLTALGFEHVTTLLASGNVVFETAKTGAAALENRVEAQLSTTFGFDIPTLLRPHAELRKLVIADPFRGTTTTPQTRRYVTFLRKKPRSLKLPQRSPTGDFRIVHVADRAVCSMLEVTKTGRTPELMGALARELGKDITTRNWNTVKKIAAVEAG